MLDKVVFFQKYKLTDDDLSKATLKWSELEEIYSDFISKQTELSLTADFIAGRLRQVDKVHSLGVRVKDSEHLLQKIIRKMKEDPLRDIKLNNYSSKITDLIGIRTLHLFKEDWIHIHEAIKKVWDLHEKPTANIREGDPINITKVFRDNGCEINLHKAGYRSVHYLVKSRLSNRIVIAEIQVRTIFEEGWSEIDHQILVFYQIKQRYCCVSSLFEQFFEFSDSF